MVLEHDAERRRSARELVVPRDRLRAQERRALVGVVGDQQRTGPLEPVARLRGEARGAVARQRERVEEGLAGLDLVVVVAGDGIEGDGTQQRPVGSEEEGIPRRRVRGRVDHVAHDHHEIRGERLGRDRAGDGVLLLAAGPAVSEHDETQDARLGHAKRELHLAAGRGERPERGEDAVAVALARDEAAQRRFVSRGPGRRHGLAGDPGVREEAHAPLAGSLGVPGHDDAVGGVGMLEVGPARHQPLLGGRGRGCRRRRAAPAAGESEWNERRQPTAWPAAAPRAHGASAGR